MWLEEKYLHIKKLSQEWRSKYLKPLWKFLADIKITPNKITGFRLLFIFPLAYYFYLGNLTGYLVVYLLFWLCDLFDGALACYLNIASDKGRFFDSFVDNLMYAFLILGFIYLLPPLAFLLAFNILMEITVQILATIKKCSKMQSDWLIKVHPNLPYFKTIAHAALLLYFFGYNYLNQIFIILNLSLTIFALYYLRGIIKE